MFLVIYLWSQKSTRCFKISDIVSTILLQDAFRELAYSGGYPFSISGDIRSVPS